MLTNAILHQQAIRLREAAKALAPTISCLKFDTARQGAGAVICKVRDGLHFLPHFLRHYRAIGARRFIFIDNGSVDGGKDYLLSQDDCDVYECLGDFRASRAGMSWKNVVLRRYQSADWIMDADVDELAVYDGWPHMGLEEFAARCSEAGLGAACGVMLDMYAPGPLMQALHPADSKDMIADFPCFDGDGYERLPTRDWRRQGFPRKMIDGGPDKRLLGTTGLPWLAKTPLLLEPGLIYMDPHTVLPAAFNFGPTLIALLHFRFNGDLMDKIRRTETLGYNRGRVSLYKAFGEKIAADPSFTPAYPGSERFTGPAQLIAKGVIDPLPLP